jgi:DNA-binding transcriptional ArsR family regulator
MRKLDERALAHAAKYYQTLAEPMRLKIINALQDGEKNVSELTTLSAGTQAHVS